MRMMDKAIRIAVEAHRGQKFPDGSPFIMHPIRLMAEVDSEDAQTVAILHEAVRQSFISINELKGLGFNESVLEALAVLTSESLEAAPDQLHSIDGNPLALEVHEADIADHRARAYSPAHLEPIAVLESESDRILSFHTEQKISSEREFEEAGDLV